MENWWRKRKLEQELARELNLAQLRLRQANAALRDVAGVPSGIPIPDSTLRIARASRDVKTAYALYRNAIDRWTHFVVHGTVPAGDGSDAAKAADTAE